MNPTLQFIANRLAEKSTWVSLGTFLTGIGVTVSPEHWQIIMGIGMGVGGVIGLLMPATVMEKNVQPAKEATPLSASIEQKTQ